MSVRRSVVQKNKAGKGEKDSMAMLSGVVTMGLVEKRSLSRALRRWESEPGIYLGYISSS